MPNFPVTFDTNASLFVAVNNKRTRLTAPITSGTLTIPVATTSGFPTSGFITILSNPDDITQAEAIKYTNTTSTTFVASQRGSGGTLPLSHNTGDNVDLTIVAEHHNELKDATIALEHFVGVSGAETFPRFTANRSIVVPGTVVASGLSTNGATVSGALNVSGSLTAAGLVRAGYLSVSGTGSFGDDLTLLRDLTVSGFGTFGTLPTSAQNTLFAVSDTSITTSSTSFVDTGVETTPLAAGNNLVLYAGNIGKHSSSSNPGPILSLRALFGGTEIGQSTGASTTVGRWGAAQLSGFFVAVGNGVNTVKLQHKASAVGDVAETGAQSIAVIPLGQLVLTSGTDYYFDNGGSTPTAPTTTLTTHTLLKSYTVNIPATDTYILMAGCELVAGPTSGHRASASFRIDGVAQFTNSQNIDLQTRSAVAVRPVTLTAGSHTLELYGATDTSGLATFSRIRFFLLRRSSFDQVISTRSSSDVATSSSTFSPIPLLTQSYSPRQVSQILVLGNAFATTDVAGSVPTFVIRNESDGENYRVDSGDNPEDTSVNARSYFFFHVLSDVATPKQFRMLIREATQLGNTVNYVDGSLSVISLAPPPSSTNILFTTVGGTKITTPTLDADRVEARQGATVSGIPVWINVPDPLVVNNLTATGTTTLNRLTVTGTTGAFSLSLTVSGQPVIIGNVPASVPDPLVLASGVFSKSLTISGVPVSIAHDLQDVYNAGTGAITTTLSKPLAINGPLTAISGSFSQSLTVSGLPVSLGGGGGTITDINAQTGPSITVVGVSGISVISESNTITIDAGSIVASGGLTLQDSYDNGDGTITTDPGKPFELLGTGALVAATGTFSAGITVGSSTSRIFPERIETPNLTVASGTFSHSLTVSGVPIMTSTGLTVREVDGSPAVSNVKTIVVTNNTLTDNGAGVVTVDTGGSGGGTLQDVYDNGDGIIITAPNKPVLVSGTLHVVSGTFTRSLTISGSPVATLTSGTLGHFPLIWIPDAAPLKTTTGNQWGGPYDDEVEGGTLNPIWTTYDHSSVSTISVDQPEGFINLSRTSTGNEFIGVYQSIPNFIPGTPVSIIAKFCPVYRTGSLDDDIWFGLALFENAASSTGDIEFFGVRWICNDSDGGTETATVAGWRALAHNTASPTQISTNLTASDKFTDGFNGTIYLRIRGVINPPGTWNGDMSFDGISWKETLVISTGFPSNILHVGMLFRNQLGSGANLVRVPFFRVINSGGRATILRGRRGHVIYSDNI